MGRPAYLTEEFYKSVRKEVKKYVNDYEEIQKRTRKLEELDKERSIRDERSYVLLKEFGAM